MERRKLKVWQQLGSQSFYLTQRCSGYLITKWNYQYPSENELDWHNHIVGIS
jgi:hypothetical protein